MMTKLTGVLLLGVCAVSSALAQDAKPAIKEGEPTVRLVYTLTESDSGKKIGVQHFALTISPSSPRGTMKLGSKIPVLTGSYNTPGAAGAVQTQFTYLDVGINIDARLLTQTTAGYVVGSKVEQSSVTEAAATKFSNPAMADEPVIRQAVLDNTALLTVGKPVVLGSLDTPGSTRHMDVEVVLEMVR